MLIAAIPTKFNIPFGNSAGGGFIRAIPQGSQIGIQAGAASLTDGFPPVCFLPIGAGGTPPWGADFNGILNQSTGWNRWQAAGGPIVYDGTFSAAIGGYPNGALIASATTAGLSWLSTADNNTSDPDAGGANWLPVSLGRGTLTYGDVKWRPTQEDLPGWTKMNGTTIGDASSGASQLASATAARQFGWLWTNFSNSQCPVSGGRGASAALDFAAHKTITVLDMRGMGPLGMDTMAGAPTTRLSGVPATSGSATQAGSVLGENLHALIIAELAAHNHAITDPTHLHTINDPTHVHGGGPFMRVVSGANNYAAGVNFMSSVNTTGAAATGITINSSATGITINNSGSGTAHNTVSLSMTGTWYCAL